MHSLPLGGSPRAVLFGTITIGLAQHETLLTIMPAFSKISNSFCTHVACFKGSVYGFWVIGRLSPVSISISIRGVFPISLESMENISLNSLHNSLMAFCCASVMSASCNSTFLCTSMSARDLINFFSVFSEIIFHFHSLSPSISLSSSNKMGEGSVEVSVTISDISKDWFCINP